MPGDGLLPQLFAHSTSRRAVMSCRKTARRGLLIEPIFLPSQKPSDRYLVLCVSGSFHKSAASEPNARGLAARSAPCKLAPVYSPLDGTAFVFRHSHGVWFSRAVMWSSARKFVCMPVRFSWPPTSRGSVPHETSLAMNVSAATMVRLLAGLGWPWRQQPHVHLLSSLRR